MLFGPTDNRVAIGPGEETPALERGQYKKNVGVVSKEQGANSAGPSF